MLLWILGLAIIIVMTVFAYRTAKDYGRSAIGWALITFAVTFGVQIILPIVIVMVIMIAMLISGKRVEQIQEDVPDITIQLIFLGLSIVGGMFILRYLSTIPEEKPFVPPPSPPKFD